MLQVPYRPSRGFGYAPVRLRSPGRAAQPEGDRCSTSTRSTREREAAAPSPPASAQPLCAAGMARAALSPGRREMLQVATGTVARWCGPARSKRSESDAGGAFPRRPFGRWCPRRSARSGRTVPGARPTRPIPLSTPEPRADGGSAAQLKAPMREDGQRFPAWPLITAVVRHSQRTGCYTARDQAIRARRRGFSDGRSCSPSGEASLRCSGGRTTSGVSPFASRSTIPTAAGCWAFLATARRSSSTRSRPTHRSAPRPPTGQPCLHLPGAHPLASRSPYRHRSGEGGLPRSPASSWPPSRSWSSSPAR